MINTKRLIDTFTELVETDSPSFDEREICDRIKKKLSDIGIAAEEDNSAAKTGGTSGNLYAYVEGSLPLPPLLFSSHMDTVEPSRKKRAIIHEDGSITSDGSTVLGADDVSGIAAIIEAVTVIKEQGLPHRPLELLFDTAEEAYCVGIQQFDFSRLKSKEVYVLDLSGEVGSAAYMAPTILSFTAEFEGRAAHAAFSPESGIHAVKAAADAVFNTECGRVGDTTVNIGTITGGSADNVVPQRCTVTGEIRSFSDSKATIRLAQIEQIFRHSAENFGAQLRFTSQSLCKAFETAVDSDTAKRYKKACAQSGLSGELIQTYGGSANNHFSQHGLTGLVAASGMNNCHSCNEYSDISELQKAARLALELMLSQE